MCIEFVVQALRQKNAHVFFLLGWYYRLGKTAQTPYLRTLGFQGIGANRVAEIQLAEPELPECCGFPREKLCCMSGLPRGPFWKTIYNPLNWVKSGFRENPEMGLKWVEKVGFDAF